MKMLSFLWLLVGVAYAVDIPFFYLFYIGMLSRVDFAISQAIFFTIFTPPIVKYTLKNNREFKKKRERGKMEDDKFFRRIRDGIRERYLDEEDRREREHPIVEVIDK